MSTRQYSLSIRLPRRDAAWLATELGALGFQAFEERRAAPGVCVIVYDSDEARLKRTRAALERRGRQHTPPVELACAIAPLEAGWEVAWTAHLEPVQLTPALRLLPHAPSGPRQPGELYLEPAFAFGFGEHASTRVAARWLEQTCRARGGSVLDVGCGTGVLALVALASGASTVVGLDTSPQAVAAARANLALNGRTGATFSTEPLSALSEVFDCVVANIEAHVLDALAPELVAHLAPGGELGLAGFIEEQCSALIERYASHGVRLAVGAREEAWCLLHGRRGS